MTTLAVQNINQPSQAKRCETSSKNIMALILYTISWQWNVGNRVGETNKLANIMKTTRKDLFVSC